MDVELFDPTDRLEVYDEFTPEYKEPYLGPDKVEVTDPHIWAPEDLLCRTLDTLGIDGYNGRWMKNQN